LLIEPGDVHGLAESLRALLRHPDRAREMGMAGRKRVEQEFSPRIVIPMLESYYLSRFDE
jgi:glycosyltransferase involved in cell wall biosynthesis